MIPNRYLRNAVMNFKNETGYAKRPTYKPPIQTAPVVAVPVKLVHEPSISEKLTASPSMAATTPAQTGVAARGPNQAIATSVEIDVKEADKPIGKASPSYEKATLSSTGKYNFSTEYE